MSENEIKPVAWLVGNSWSGPYALRNTDPNGWGYAEPLMRIFDHQSAIDALTQQISELKTMLSIAEFQRKEMQAERDAAMADAGRYRWLRDNCQEAADYYATTGQLYFGTYGYSGIDAAIDAARAEGRA